MIWDTAANSLAQHEVSSPNTHSRKRRKGRGEEGVLILTDVTEAAAFLLRGLFPPIPTFQRASTFPGGKIYDALSVELSEVAAVITLCVFTAGEKKLCALVLSLMQ